MSIEIDSYMLSVRYARLNPVISFAFGQEADPAIPSSKYTTTSALCINPLRH